MITGSGNRGAAGTRLAVVTTNAADTADVLAWLQPLPRADVAVTAGYYAGVAAFTAGRRAVVVEIGAPEGRESWRLAELRQRSRDVTYVVVADATLLPHLSGALRTDLAVTSVSRLPPLRELLVTDYRLADDQTIWRRTMR